MQERLDQFKPLIILAIVVLVAIYVTLQADAWEPQVTDFESCARMGNPIAESYPLQCVADGKTYIQK